MTIKEAIMIVEDFLTLRHKNFGECDNLAQWFKQDIVEALQILTDFHKEG